MESDARWFKQHPGRNLRVRLPEPGEVEAIARASHPVLAHIEILPAPDATLKWCVAVVAINRRARIKMLVLRPIAWDGEDESEGGWSVYTTALMQNAFVEQG